MGKSVKLSVSGFSVYYDDDIKRSRPAVKMATDTIDLQRDSQKIDFIGALFITEKKFITENSSYEILLLNSVFWVAWDLLI